jgi:hypothetical protein
VRVPAVADGHFIEVNRHKPNARFGQLPRQQARLSEAILAVTFAQLCRFRIEREQRCPFGICRTR